MAHETAWNWIGKMNQTGKRYFGNYVLSLDEDDKFLSKYKELFVNEIFQIVVGSNKNVVQAMNAGARHANGKILVCISDDFDCPEEWDKLIWGNIDHEVKEALQVDVIHDDIKEETNILTLPIITKKLYDFLGYVYYPEYTGIRADDDLAELCLSQGWLRKNWNLKFLHKHWSSGYGIPDSTHRRHDNTAGWKLGDSIIEKRKENNFGLEKPEIILSILIPTVTGRERVFAVLANLLFDAVKKAGYQHIVEFAYYRDNKEISIGAKRQFLYEQAQGKYSWQIDDDDSVNPEVFKKVIPHLLKHPAIDCVGFLEECIWDGNKKAIAKHSDEFMDWGETTGAYQYYRTIFYKDIIRTSIAKQVGVKDLRYGEDHDFARRLKASGLLKQPYFLDEIIYYYNCNAKEPHNQKYGIQ